MEMVTDNRLLAPNTGAILLVHWSLECSAVSLAINKDALINPLSQQLIETVGQQRCRPRFKEKARGGHVTKAGHVLGVFLGEAEVP